jgi:hypothetical protein
MVRGLPPELLAIFDSADDTLLPPLVPEPAIPSPGPGAQSREQMTDLVLDALDDVVMALRENDREIETALARAASVRQHRLEGESYSAIVGGHDEPLLVTLLADIQRRLTQAGARLRRAKARALYSEGKTMEQIAELFGVTRQRISALVSAANDEPSRL